MLFLIRSVQDLTLEKIEELFSKPWLERVNIFYYLRCSCFLECVPNCCRKAEATPTALEMEMSEGEVEVASSSSTASGVKDLFEVEIENKRLIMTEL